MTEEEKKAIEYLKRYIMPVYGRKGNIEYMLNDVLLNLIEKQQKKLEKEKEKNKKVIDYIEKNKEKFKNLDYAYPEAVINHFNKINNMCLKGENNGK